MILYGPRIMISYRDMRACFKNQYYPISENSNGYIAHSYSLLPGNKTLGNVFCIKQRSMISDSYKHIRTVNRHNIKSLRIVGMKRWIGTLIPLYFIFVTSAYADGIFFEGGSGFFYSDVSQSLFLSYHLDSPQIFGFDTFYGLAFGTWNGDNGNDAVVLVKGFVWNLPEKTYLCIEPGGAYITEITDNLGTNLQFAFRGALGIRIQTLDLSVGYRHFSNGKGVFRWTDTANRGENFATFQIGYLF